jgi:hypothetical protein
LDQHSYVQEWDTSQNKWSPGRDPFATWLETTFSECAEDLNSQ